MKKIILTVLASVILLSPLFADNTSISDDTRDCSIISITGDNRTVVITERQKRANPQFNDGILLGVSELKVYLSQGEIFNVYTFARVEDGLDVYASKNTLIIINPNDKSTASIYFKKNELLMNMKCNEYKSDSISPLAPKMGSGRESPL